MWTEYILGRQDPYIEFKTLNSYREMGGVGLDFVIENSDMRVLYRQRFPPSIFGFLCAFEVFRLGCCGCKILNVTK